MIIGIISDTHDHIEHIDRAIEIFKAKKVGKIIHLGDYVSPSMILRFSGLNVCGIYGNCDGERIKMIERFAQVHATLLGDFNVLIEDSLKIALYHGTEKGLLDALITCGTYDVVCYGHTHVVDSRVVGKTMVINPGTTHGFGKYTPTIAFLDTVTKKVQIIELQK